MQAMAYAISVMNMYTILVYLKKNYCFFYLYMYIFFYKIYFTCFLLAFICRMAGFFSVFSHFFFLHSQI